MSELSLQDKIMVLLRAMKSNGTCDRCNKALPPGTHPATKYCDDCKTPAYQRKGVYRAQAVCEECGIDFESKSPTTLRCPTCRKARATGEWSVVMEGWRRDGLRRREAEGILSVLVELHSDRGPTIEKTAY